MNIVPQPHVVWENRYTEMDRIGDEMFRRMEAAVYRQIVESKAVVPADRTIYVRLDMTLPADAGLTLDLDLSDYIR
jgi:hypothetical protein